jgi:ribosomal protein S6
MKKFYELVCVIDARLSMDEIRGQFTMIEGLVGDSKVAIDDMWLLPLAYPMKGQQQAYFISYALHIETDLLSELKRALSIEKSIMKFHLFSLKSAESFQKFADLKKVYADIAPQLEEVEEVKEEEDKPVLEVASSDDE